MEFASTIRASVAECIGDKWSVCVNTYPEIEKANDNGDLPNPEQVMKTFASESEAVEFAKSFNPSHLKIEKGGIPFYLNEYKWKFAND